MTRIQALFITFFFLSRHHFELIENYLRRSLAEARTRCPVEMGCPLALQLFYKLQAFMASQAG